MIARADVDRAVEELRPLVQADGADLLLDHVDTDGGRVTLRLDLDGVTCLECVLPPDPLHGMVVDAMSRRVPGLATVSIEDPRQDGS